MSKSTTQAVAFELRRIADALDKKPGITIEQPMISFYCNNYTGDRGKAVFQNLARVLPRPLTKEFTDTSMMLTYKNDAVWLRAQIDRSHICELVHPAQPAEWKCDSLFSDEEEADFTRSVSA